MSNDNDYDRLRQRIENECADILRHRLTALDVAFGKAASPSPPPTPPKPSPTERNGATHKPGREVVTETNRKGTVLSAAFVAAKSLDDGFTYHDVSAAMKADGIDAPPASVRQAIHNLLKAGKLTVVVESAGRRPATYKAR